MHLRRLGVRILLDWSFLGKDILVELSFFVGDGHVFLQLKGYDFWLYTCTQMTLVFNVKGLLLEGSNPKIEDKRVPGIHLSFELKYTHKYGDIVALS